MGVILVYPKITVRRSGSRYIRSGWEWTVAGRVGAPPVRGWRSTRVGAWWRAVQISRNPGCWPAAPPVLRPWVHSSLNWLSSPFSEDGNDSHT